MNRERLSYVIRLSYIVWPFLILPFTGFPKILNKYGKRIRTLTRLPFTKEILQQTFFPTDLLSKLQKPYADMLNHIAATSSLLRATMQKKSRGGGHYRACNYWPIAKWQHQCLLFCQKKILTLSRSRIFSILCMNAGLVIELHIHQTELRRFYSLSWIESFIFYAYFLLVYTWDGLHSLSNERLHKLWFYLCVPP